MPYGCRVPPREDRTAATSFGAWLISAYRSAGYRSASALAHAADVEPSIVNRWLRGDTVPTAANLLKIAPALRVEESALFAAAFGADTGQPPPPVALKITRLLGPDSPLDDRERDLLAEILDRILAGYPNT